MYLLVLALHGHHLCFSHQAAAPVTQSNNTVTPPAVEEEEDGEEFEDLSAVLEHLGMSEYKSTFDEEKIDIESFVRITVLFVFFSKEWFPSLKDF